MKEALSAITIVLLAAFVIGLATLPAADTASAGPVAGLAASTTLYPVADTWVNYMLPAGNYGTATLLEIGSEECPGREFPDRGRTLIRFDLSAIPAGQAIQSASLQLYLRYAYSGGASTNRIALHRITSSWTETGVTWNNQLGHGLRHHRRRHDHRRLVQLGCHLTGARVVPGHVF